MWRFVPELLWDLSLVVGTDHTWSLLELWAQSTACTNRWGCTAEPSCPVSLSSSYFKQQSCQHVVLFIWALIYVQSSSSILCALSCWVLMCRSCSCFNCCHSDELFSCLPLCSWCSVKKGGGGNHQKTPWCTCKTEFVFSLNKLSCRAVKCSTSF